MSAIGTHIKARRKYLKISQRQLADLSEVSINTITKIERNEGNPTLEVLEKVLDTLGMELAALHKLDRDDDFGILLATAQTDTPGSVTVKPL